MADSSFQFDEPTARRVLSATRQVEDAMPRETGVIPQHIFVSDDDDGGGGLSIGKTASTWAKGDKAAIDVYDSETMTSTGQTEEVMNLFADVEADKWVAWISGFLVSAEC